MFLDVAIMGLAAWRVSVLLTMERGPFGFALWLRERTGITHTESGDIASNPPTGFGKILSCVWCVSFWIAIAFMPTTLYFPILTVFIATWGAASLIHGLAFGRD